MTRGLFWQPGECGLNLLAAWAVVLVLMCGSSEGVTANRWDWSQLKQTWYKQQFKKIESTCDSIPDYNR